MTALPPHGGARVNLQERSKKGKIGVTLCGGRGPRPRRDRRGPRLHRTQATCVGVAVAVPLPAVVAAVAVAAVPVTFVVTFVAGVVGATVTLPWPSTTLNVVLAVEAASTDSTVDLVGVRLELARVNREVERVAVRALDDLGRARDAAEARGLRLVRRLERGRRDRHQEAVPGCEVGRALDIERVARRCLSGIGRMLMFAVFDRERQLGVGVVDVRAVDQVHQRVGRVGALQTAGAGRDEEVARRVVDTRDAALNDLGDVELRRCTSGAGRPRSTGPWPGSASCRARRCTGTCRRP